MKAATKHPLYGRYATMKNRCNNPKKIHYRGRGIKVCDRWLTSFWLFLEDMGERPHPKRIKSTASTATATTPRRIAVGYSRSSSKITAAAM